MRSSPTRFVPLRSADWAVLRNLVIVVLLSTCTAVVVGMSCLGRGQGMLDGAEPGGGSVRSSAGGVPATQGATITAGEVERGASASAASAAPAPDPEHLRGRAAPPTPAATPAAPAPLPMPPPHAPATRVSPTATAPPASPPPHEPPRGARVAPPAGIAAGIGRFVADDPPSAGAPRAPERAPATAPAPPR